MSVPFTAEARWLMQAGALTLSRMSAVGLPVDVPYCVAARKKLLDEMVSIEASVWKVEGGKEWKRQYGSEATLSNDNQLRWCLKNLGVKRTGSEDSDEESNSVDKEFMEDVDHPIAPLVLEYRRRVKVANTVLKGFITEATNGIIHPSLLLNLVRSYRTSSSEPNGQNIPNRDPEMMAICRRAIQVPKGKRLVCSDWKQLEVRIAACYHKDPTALRHIQENYDIHRDMAMMCYCLTRDQYDHCLPKPKVVRHAGKNSYVFPAYYGSYWRNIAPNLWREMVRRGFAIDRGVPFAKHLESHGITGLGKLVRDERGRVIEGTPGSFYEYIKKVDKHFWGTLFPVYAQWKVDYYKKFQRLGYFDSLSGFHYEGPYSKNDVTNHPVQGSASHCKVLSCILAEADLWERPKMLSRLCLEIHDDIMAVVPDEEVDDYVPLITECQTKKVMDRWDWIITPMEVEVEVTPSGGSWNEKTLYTV